MIVRLPPAGRSRILHVARPQRLCRTGAVVAKLSEAPKSHLSLSVKFEKPLSGKYRRRNTGLFRIRMS